MDYCAFCYDENVCPGPGGCYKQARSFAQLAAFACWVDLISKSNSLVHLKSSPVSIITSAMLPARSGEIETLMLKAHRAFLYHYDVKPEISLSFLVRENQSRSRQVKTVARLRLVMTSGQPCSQRLHFPTSRYTFKIPTSEMTIYASYVCSGIPFSFPTLRMRT